MIAARSDRSALIRALHDAERMVATLREALAVLPTDEPGAPFIDEDEVALKVAAHLSNRSAHTVRRWAIKHNLGRKCGGTWLISRRRLRTFMESGAE